MSEVLVKHGERKELAVLFGVTPRCVYNALLGLSKSDKAKKIRKAAIERGGSEVEIKPKQKIS